MTTTFTSGYTAANGSTPAFNYIYPSSSYTSLVGLGTYTYPFYYIDATIVVTNAIAGLTDGITTTVVAARAGHQAHTGTMFTEHTYTTSTRQHTSTRRCMMNSTIN